MSVPSQIVAVDPTLVTEPDATATRIAEILGIGESNVTTKLSRLRQRLRTELA